MTAWRRDTIASGSTRSFEGSRPTDTRLRWSAISRREDDVGLTISLAIPTLSIGSSRGDASSRLPRLLPLQQDLHLVPGLLAGGVAPFRDRVLHGAVQLGAVRLQHLDVAHGAL